MEQLGYSAGVGLANKTYSQETIALTTGLSVQNSR